MGLMAAAAIVATDCYKSRRSECLEVSGSASTASLEPTSTGTAGIELGPSYFTRNLGFERPCWRRWCLAFHVLRAYWTECLSRANLGGTHLIVSVLRFVKSWRFQLQH